MVLLDDERNVWVVGEDDISVFKGDTWTTYNESNTGLPSDSSLLYIALDPNGLLWIGTKNGLFLYSNSEEFPQP